MAHVSRDLPIGNGSLLVNFDRNYQLRDIYYPRVGQENHTSGEPCRFGIWVEGRFSWLDDPAWSRNLVYLPDTLVTTGTSTGPTSVTPSCTTRRSRGWSPTRASVASLPAARSVTASDWMGTPA